MRTPPAELRQHAAFYSLHAWIWKDNPSGMFSMWNPAANCTRMSDGMAENAASD